MAHIGEYVMKQKTEKPQEIKGDEAVASGVWPISTMNDAGTSALSGTQLTQRCSRPVRYRLISPDGKAYAAFRLKEGVPLYHVTRGLRGVGWQVEVVGT